MKRVLIILITVCILSLCACSKRKATMLVAGVSEGSHRFDSMNVDVDLSSKFIVLDALDSYEYELDNEKLICKYIKSSISPYYNCDTDIYSAIAVDGREVELRVNRNTKKVVAYMVAYREGYTTVQSKSYEECYQIAKSKLSEFDDEEYVQVFQDTHSKALYIPECGDVFSYYFRKEYNGIPTSVLVQIDVNTDGVVTQVNATEILEFDNEDKAYLKNYNQNESSLVEEIKNDFMELINDGKEANTHLEIQKSSFCKLKDGCIYIICEIAIEDKETKGFDYVRVLKRV